MNNTYTSPQVEIVVASSVDVITVSGTETPILPEMGEFEW